MSSGVSGSQRAIVLRRTLLKRLSIADCVPEKVVVLTARPPASVECMSVDHLDAIHRYFGFFSYGERPTLEHQTGRHPSHQVGRTALNEGYDLCLPFGSDP